LSAEATADDAQSALGELRRRLVAEVAPSVEVSPLNGDLAFSLARKRRMLRHWPNEVERADRDPRSWFSKVLPAAEKRAKRKRQPFALSREDLRAICLRSSGCCEVTGLPFSMTGHGSSKMRPFAPSLDRIDSARGYESGNCRLVCAAVNIAMFSWGEELFRSIAVGYVTNLLRRWQPAGQSLPPAKV
jgi:hypothetical protein